MNKDHVRGYAQININRNSICFVIHLFIYFLHGRRHVIALHWREVIRSIKEHPSISLCLFENNSDLWIYQSIQSMVACFFSMAIKKIGRFQLNTGPLWSHLNRPISIIRSFKYFLFYCVHKVAKKMEEKKQKKGTDNTIFFQ